MGSSDDYLVFGLNVLYQHRTALFDWLNNSMNNKNTIKYFLYARKSTDEEDRQITSISDQIREMKKLASGRGLKIVHVFEESKSAKNIGRPVFNEMIERINKGEATGIICWKADRLARNMVDGGNIINMLQNGVIEHIQAFDGEYKPEDNVIVLSVAFSSSTQYSKDLSVNVKRGMIAKAKRGWLPNKAPLGYSNVIDKDRNEKTIIIPDDNFKLVKKLFDSVLNKNATLEQLETKARKMGLTTKQGGKLHISTIHRILNNPFYYGKYEWPENSGEWHKGKHKKMISFDEYKTVQEILTRKTKARFKKHDINYRGLMTCKCCGGAITASKITKKQKNGNIHEYVYYHCGKKVDKNCTQRSFPLREVDFEKQVMSILEKIEIPQDIYNWAMSELKQENDFEKEARAKMINAHRKNHDRETNKIHRLIDMRADEEISKEEYVKKRKEAEQNRDYAESKISEIENNNKAFIEKADDLFSFAKDAKEKFKNGSPKQRKETILNLGSNLQICDKKLMISLDLGLKPFEKYAKGAREEMNRVKPLDIGLDKRKTALIGTAFPVMSG